MLNPMIPILIPVPPAPVLERAVGYLNERNARYLALWWDPCGDEAMISDGFITFTGHWPGYLAFVQHPDVATHLAGIDLGSSENTARHRLLIDLQERRAFIGKRYEVERVLSDQWVQSSSTQPDALIVEDLDVLLDEWVESKADFPTMADVMLRMEEDRKAVETLQTWLDEQHK